MQAVIHNTQVFKNIFKTYDVFRGWYRNTPFCESDEDIPSEKTYSLIAYRYNDSHLSMTEESFLQHFAIELYTYVKEFEETTKAINELMKLDENDFYVDNTMITNIADIPEKLYDTDSDKVDFVSSQQKMINKKGKLRVKKEQLASKRALTTRTFLKRFKYLFITILSSPYTPVVGEPEGVDNYE